MANLYLASKQSAQSAIADDGRWLTGVSGIVAENNDPEKQHRVKVIIPSIDEDLIYDEWARQLVFCLGNGYGSAFIPPKGSEVVLFGTLGQKFNLFYASVYNEEMLMPEGYPDEMTVGVSAPGNLHFIARQVAKILAQNIEINAQQLTKVSGNNVQVQASAESLLKGDSVKIEGSTISISQGNISIQGGNVTIAGDSVKIHGRTVNKTGPAI